MGARDDASIWGMSPQRIYEEITGGPGTFKLNDARDATEAESKEEGIRAESVRELGVALESGWQGTAGEGAFHATKPLVRASYQGSDLLHMGQDLLTRQGESFETAKNSVEPVADKPPELGVEALVDHSILVDVAQYQESSQKNVQAFAAYDNASMYNEEHAPVEYTSPSQAGGDSGGYAGGMIDSDDYRQDGDGGPGGSSGGPGSSGPGGSAPYGSGAPGGLVPGGAPSGSTNTAGYDSTLRPSSGPYPGIPGPSHSSGGAPAGVGPLGFGVGGGSGGGGGTGGGLGGGGRGPGGGAPGRGPGAGALAAEEAAARRGGVGATGPGGRGAAGGMGGAPMGGGKGKGDEDTEHQRKYLIGPDPDATFDTDVLTAPPVIGEDDEDY
jgi:hypothetical protein